jgi:hypothetical protein
MYCVFIADFFFYVLDALAIYNAGIPLAIVGFFPVLDIGRYVVMLEVEVVLHSSSGRTNVK